MAKNSASLATFLKEADERVRQAAANALNEASDEVIKQVKANMAAQGIREDTGKLRGSVKANKATTKSLNVVIKSEVFKPAPRRAGWRNPKMRGRYKYGVPYGRIIEFSPRIKKPFFYKAWYEKRKQVKSQVIKAIEGAWSNG